jgi:hypothetical protein
MNGSGKSEAELLSALDAHDTLLIECAKGRLELRDMIREYDNFYWSYPLDGHESTPGPELLSRYQRRIELHRQFSERVLAHLCGEIDARCPEYQDVGRFGESKALNVLRDLVRTHTETVA